MGSLSQTIIPRPTYLVPRSFSLRLGVDVWGMGTGETSVIGGVPDNWAGYWGCADLAVSTTNADQRLGVRRRSRYIGCTLSCPLSCPLRAGPQTTHANTHQA